MKYKIEYFVTMMMLFLGGYCSDFSTWKGIAMFTMLILALVYIRFRFLWKDSSSDKD